MTDIYLQYTNIKFNEIFKNHYKDIQKIYILQRDIHISNHVTALPSAHYLVLLQF